MKSNYKQLGRYISEVNIKNTNLEVDLLLGVSITKKFIPSIANTIGTDMSKYKVVRKNQFGYGPITSRNGDKISVALLTEEQCIISTSYRVFEIKDHEELDPEYLMMWFRRPEFDRYARFMSHGSTREAFDWDEMCETELPVPSIEKQREIVKEYNIIVNRIKLNEQLNQKLEETAQALYKNWFVDFEFPNENGQPYKSSGGKMVYNDELDKDVPEGWDLNNLGSEFDITIGRTPPRNQPKWFNGENGLKWVSIKDLGTNSTYVIDTEETLTEEAIVKFNVPIIPKNTTILSFKMSVGKVSITNEDMLSNEAIAHMKIKNDTRISSEYIYCYLANFHFNSLGTTSSIVTSINSTMVKDMRVIIPSTQIISKFNDCLIPIFNRSKNIELHNKCHHKLISVLLSKMSKVESLKAEQVL